MEEQIIENRQEGNKNNSQKQIAGAIIIAGVIIAGAILLKGNVAPTTPTTPTTTKTEAPAKVSINDKTLGDAKAKVIFILYSDFQCPFCGAISGLASENSEIIKYLKQKASDWAPFMPMINEYVKNGNVQFVYRDWAFLGTESVKSAEAARCAGDQNKFWEYHDYLYGHQNGENKGAFSDSNLKSFAKNLGLNTSAFNSCLDTNKYTQAVNDSKAEGIKAGVTGTPRGFILRDGKVVATVNGAEPASSVKQKIDSALK